ncbi:Tubulin alpha-3 chain [Symbiodinium microadriaticum]|uniref:Tubulin alpha-3 chain n=1 Tax=Symbiodinium microadriaticum TaxID=2951 RepID=A0A1Q9EDL0_SYMMI|nr:Tubulin alpha-3 chain [Symbiodinium microadriaticum]
MLSTHCDDRVVSADTDIVIDSSVASACTVAAAGPRENTYQAVHCEPAAFADPRGLQAARGMVLFTELHDEVRLFSAVWHGVWEPLCERSSFALATRSARSIGNDYFCLKQGIQPCGQQDKTTGGGHDAFRAGVAGVDSVVVRVRSSEVDCPSHNNLYRLVAWMVCSCSSTALLCFGGALNMDATELEVNMAPCPHSQASKSRRDWMQFCFDPGGDTDPLARRLLSV